MSSPADNYWPEPCAYCQGRGKLQINVENLDPQFLKKADPQGRRFMAQYGDEPDCIVCGGKALVLVLQPARQCRYCEGTGKRLQTRCFYCKGTGWMFVRNEGVGFLR